MYTQKTYDYIASLYPEDASFTGIRDYAAENGIPIMKSGVYRLLETLCALKAPKRILELGTAIGYSGSVMLKTCTDAFLTTIENEWESYLAAKENFSITGVQSRVNQIYGDTAGEVRKLTEGFDFIFLDSAKAQYIKLLPLLTERLNDNGVLIADNVLFRGFVSGEEKLVRRKITIVKRLREFLAAVTAHPLLTTTILPIDDGVSISVKRDARAK